MITYRHHVVTLVAVFLALAVGVALGGGPLGEGPTAREMTPARADTQEARQAAEYGDEFAEATAARLYEGRLADRPVAIVTLPGSDDAVVAGLTEQVELAEGSVTARYDVQPVLVSASEKNLVDTMGRQLADELGVGVVEADAPTYVRMGQLIGVAAATTAQAADPAGDDALAVRQSLAGAELLVSPESEVPRAPAVVVVLGEDGATPEEQAVLEGLLTGLAETAAAVVLVGSAEQGQPGGTLADLRREPVADVVSTVDGADSVLGQVTAVLAVLRRLAGEGGQFGASGADGVVPLG